MKLRKYDGPGRAVAHEMWALYGPLHPAHDAAHVFSWAGPGRGPRCGVLYCYYYDIYPAHEAAHVFSHWPMRCGVLLLYYYTLLQQ